MLNLIEKWKEVERQGGKSMNLSIRVVLNEQNFTLIEGVQALMDEREWTFSKTSLHLMNLVLIDRLMGLEKRKIK
jgi:hypothetical protein